MIVIFTGIAFVFIKWTVESFLNSRGIDIESQIKEKRSKRLRIRRLLLRLCISAGIPILTG